MNVKFNINGHVRVQLTDHGRAILKASHDKLFGEIGLLEKYPFTPPKEDEGGWSDFQMWDLMQSFGPHIGMTRENCFETTIEIIFQS